MKPFKSLVSNVGEITITGAKRVTIEIGARSRIQSYGNFGVTAACTMPVVELIEQCVAVRIGFHHCIGRERASGAALILHHHLLTKHFRKDLAPQFAR